MTDTSRPGRLSLHSQQESGGRPCSHAPPRGLHVIYLLNNLSVGGSETKIVQIANALVERNLRVGIVHLNEPLDLAARLRPEIPVWHLQRRGAFSLRAARLLRRVIREQRPCALVAVNLYPALYSAVATALLGDRPRTVGLINSISFPHGQEWRRSFYRLVLTRLDGAVYGCELQRSLWLPERHRMRARSRVIYNGVDPGRYQRAGSACDGLRERARYGIGGHSFVIGSVGRLAPEKNQAVLIDAAVQLRRAGRDVHLLLVGDGRMRAALERKVAECGAAAYVSFAGTLQDVRPALAIMDVFVLPSHVETFSNAALEAMAMGNPVILSRIGGAAEMVREGVEGFILGPEQFASELPRLIERLQADAALRERLGTAARRRVEREFSLETMVDQYQTLIGPAFAAGAAPFGTNPGHA